MPTTDAPAAARTAPRGGSMHEDAERCVRAVRSRDARFDGWFFIAVTSTGIYCRPSCPAVPPKAENMRFHPSAASAQQAGFRACKRCRPDASPGSPAWNHRADLVARAMRLIADGVVDRDGVPGLAARLGYSARQVERHLLAELGAGPLALARAQRAQTARLLIETTSLSMGDVATAAGFRSIRAFNDTVREVFATAPTDLRRRRPASPTAPSRRAAPAGTLTLRLPFRAPLCPDNLFGHLVATAVPGVEEWRDGAYRRTLRTPNGHAFVTLRPLPDHIACQLALTDMRDLATAISRCRRLLDLDADPVAVDEQLATDPALGPLVEKAPGRRVPRTVDPVELALRAVIGQQVSTAAARTHAARLVQELGEPVTDPAGGLAHLWPTTADLAGYDNLAMPAARRRTFTELARRLASGDLDLGAGSDWQRARAELATVPGVGPWTIETIAMRALGDPDAFLPGDLGVRRGADHLGLPATPAALVRHAAGWRPWRAYAVQYLWAMLDHPINRMPPVRDSLRRKHLPKGPVMTRAAPQTDDRTHTVVDSPIGPLTLVASNGVLVGCYMDAQRHLPDHERFGEPDDSALGDAVGQVEEYFAGRRTAFDLPLVMEGTAFQQRVWKALRDIPYAETISYGELARRIGQPSASRAVGLANGRNPISIIVPCHRVIGANGSLTGYGGGLERKRHLLAFEQQTAGVSLL